MREKHLTYNLDNESRLDVRLELERGRIKFFVINLSLIMDDKIVSVWRCDNAHGYPHEQKFWRSPKPIKLGETDIKRLYHKKLDEIRANYKKYIKYYKEAIE